MKLPLIVLVVVALASQFCNAQEGAAETYRKKAEGAVFVCSLAMRVYMAEQHDDQLAQYQKCVSDARAETNANFQAVVKATKKPKAKEALKMFHAAFLSTLDATGPRGSDSKSTFETRQSVAADKMSDAWAKFEVER